MYFSAQVNIHEPLLIFAPCSRNGRIGHCRDKFEAAKLQKMKTDATQELESCVNRSIDDSIRVLPHVVEQMKSSLNIN